MVIIPTAFRNFKHLQLMQRHQQITCHATDISIVRRSFRLRSSTIFELLNRFRILRFQKVLAALYKYLQKTSWKS
jgi:hypothetical protein